MREDLDGLGPRFRLDAFVARGAWGAVYRGVDLQTGAGVAVKRLHRHLCEPSMITRFEREAILLAALDSPHAVRHVDHGRDVEGRPYLALEWLDGEDLARWRRRRRPTRREIVEVVRQAALGLSALHAAGIVHRDVKPSNFFRMQAAGGVAVKLIDLGVARVSGETTLTATGFTLGTPAYMSPEQARGEPRPTPASDLFSLGVVLFELFAGRKPYRGEDMVSLAMKIVLQDPPRLRDAVPGAPAGLDELLARAMSKAPADRFPSALAFAEALGALEVGDEPAEQAPESDPGAGASRIVVTESGPASGVPALWTLAQAAEQRVVTALFARFDGTAEPGPAIEGFRDAVERHGGVFHRVLGPQRAAVFGAGRARADDAPRAARAALAAATIPGVRLSIVTGRAVADEASLAGGLIERGLAEVRRSRGDVRVDETTARLLEGRFTVEGSRGERVLRVAEPLPDDFGPRLLGKPVPFVGRDREAASLYAIFEECVAEPVARAVLVTGPPGAGKSRLIYELLRRAGAGKSPPTVLRARGEAAGAAAPFGMIGPALRRAAGIAEGDPPDERRRKLDAHLSAGLPGPAQARARAALGELAHVPLSSDDDGPLSARSSALTANDAMRAAWEDWIAAECAARPVILVLEDLHWGDLPSVTFVDAALRHARAAPLLVVAAARPDVHERFPGLFAGRGLEEVRLSALTRKASEKLVRRALGPDADDAVVQRVVERAEGNPFFLGELVRAVAEGGAEDLPETVLGMVQARLDTLGPEPRRLLRAASVLGRTFWVGAVEALLGHGGGEGRVRAILAELEAAEMVVRRGDADGVPGEVEYAFSHALVRDGAYAMLTEADRASAHRLAGAWLEGRGVADAAIVAQHFERAGDPAAGRAHRLRAAEEALAGNDLATAIDHAERGAASLAGVSTGEEGAGEELGCLRLVQAEAHRFRGELALAEARAGEALALLSPRGPRWLRAAAELASAAGLLGHVDRVEAVARALPREADPERRSAAIVCLCRAAIPLFWAGQAASGDLFARAFSLSEPLDALDHEARALVSFSHATRALHAGRPGEHLLAQRAAEAAFSAGGDRRNALGRKVAVGFGEVQLGLWAAAEITLREALAAGERLGVFNLTVRARNNLGPALAGLRRLDEARAVEELAIEGCLAQGDPRLEAGSRLYLSDILLRADDRAGAEREAQRALALAAAAPPTRARALATLARVRLGLGDVAAARASAGEAASLLASLGQVDEGESLIRLALAESLLASGEEGAAEAVAAAARRVEERAASIEDPAWRASFLAIPENAATLALGSLWVPSDP